MAQRAEGEMLAAADSFDIAIGHFLKADNVLFAVRGMVVLAQIKVRLGRLLEAIEINEQALQLIAQRGKPLFRSIAMLHRNLSQILCEQGDLEAAWYHLNQSAKQSEQAGEIESEHGHDVAKATLAWASGDLAAAEEHLDRATANYRPGRMAEYAPIEAIKCRIWLVQGELSRAQDWATQHKLSATDEPAFLREYEHLTLARLYMATYRRNKERTLLEDTFSLLNRLLQSARADKRMGSEIECLLLLALAENAQSNRQDAMTHLANSLRLAQPQGYMQLFVREGAPLADLLKTAVSHNIAPDYATRLLAALGETAVQQQSLVDPLSERELEILQLIATGLKNKKIAATLFLSVNTVHYHTKNLYSKLGVNSRTQAISRAKALNLLA
jgi:LuxR family maltose regulon positive regulatory protein